jgi:hypothetical protein
MQINFCITDCVAQEGMAVKIMMTSKGDTIIVEAYL